MDTPGTEATSLASRGLRPVAELASTREHGERLRYMAGCRCFKCRSANTAYEAQRKVARAAGDWNGIVSAERARAHMVALAVQGVGRRALGDACDIADSILGAIRTGQKTHIRARTERAILAITAAAAADGAYVDAAPTWRLLEELISSGYSRTFLARELGSTAKTPALQLGREQVTVRHAADVVRLHERLRTNRLHVLQPNAAKPRPGCTRRVTATGPEKWCTRCEDWWPADREFFRVAPGRADGLFYCCIACEREWIAASRAKKQGAA